MLLTQRSVIAARIRDRAESTANALVDWCPQLTSPGGTPTNYNCLDLEICGETEVLNLTNEPYLVISDLTICATGTLIVEQGVELQIVKADPQLTACRRRVVM